MNLPSASSVTRGAKPSHSCTSSSDLVLDLHINGGICLHSSRNGSPEIKSEPDIASSAYSDAGDTFASRPSNAVYEADHDAAVSSGPFNNVQDLKDNVDSRDFILKRFLPAAQAMAATGVKSSASTSSLPSDRRPSSNSSSVPTARSGCFVSRLSKNKNRSVLHEVKQNVRGVEDEGDAIRACGFPLHLGRLTLQHFRYGCCTSRSISCLNSTQTTKKVSKKVNHDEEAENSDEVFWSDEEGFEKAMSHRKSAAKMHERESNSLQLKKGLAAETLAAPARLHCMETVHTPDHRGFLGLPKASKLSSGEMERARQVDRLGARLTRMLSKTNYMESRNARVHEHDENEAGSSSKGPSATTSSFSARTPRSKWMDAVASLRPPPSPKMPSESWLSNTLPPDRALQARKFSRKPLGSFIPIKPPVKPMPDSQPKPKEYVSLRLRQSCSLKEHLQGRQVNLRGPNMQTV